VAEFISRGFTGRRRVSEDLGARLPPGQYVEPGYPVLTAGPTPHIETSDWKLRVDGGVGSPREWTWDEFHQLPFETIPCDIHCVTKWSKLGTNFGGVSVDTLLDGAEPRGDYVVQYSYGGYSTNLPLEDVTGGKAWVAYAFGGEPLYTRVGEDRDHSLEGSDFPGWHNVYTQKAPPPPSDFTVQESPGGLVLADSRGKTVYIYHCGDDGPDQLSCDHPQAAQAYRFAVCGGGDPARCLKTFPYVLATPGVKSSSRVWSVLAIDPRTGHLAAPGLPDALHVWAFRERPVFTCALDEKPGDLRADGWGEFNGYRNGFKAFWLRDDFTDNAG